MTLWIAIAIISYLLFALNGVADKFLLTKAVKDPGVYVFYVGTGSIALFLLAPFGLHMLPWDQFFIALMGGMSFAGALYFFYSAIQETSISRILPIEGGLVPLFSLILVYFTKVEKFDSRELVAFILLVSGSILMAFKKTESGWHAKAWRNGTIAAFLFAVSFVISKFIYGQTNFLSGLIWVRAGLILGSLSMLVFSSTRKQVFAAPRKTSSGNKLLFYAAAVAGSMGGWLQNYAIAIGSVVIVNALQGVQFAFILIISVFLSEFYPKIIKEDVNTSIIVQKVIGIILISIGLFRL